MDKVSCSNGTREGPQGDKVNPPEGTREDRSEHILVQKTRAAIKAYSMLESGECVLVALSGGADSVALLLSLRKLGYALSACHLNHGLRGAEADRDEAFCRSLCEKLGVPILVQRSDAAAYARERRESVESAARDLRYAFFEKAARQSGADKIATAHTASDNLETMIFHLARGTGLDGLCGIPPVRGKIVRPILGCTRAEVEHFLQVQQQDFVTDSSNASGDYSRNRIRHEVTPVLTALNPRAEQAAADLSTRLRLDAAYLQQQAQDLLRAAAQDKGWGVQRLRGAPPAVRSRALRLLCAQAGMPLRDFTARHVAALEGLLEGENPSACLSFPGGFVALREYDVLRIAREKEPQERDLAEIPVQIPFYGALGKGFSQVRLQHVEKDRLFYKSFNTFYVDCDTIDSSTLVLRTRRAGDRLRLRGGSKTLKKIMIDKKIPRGLRDRLTVLADRHGPIAVQSIGADAGRSPKDGGIVEIQFEG